MMIERHGHQSPVTPSPGAGPLLLTSSLLRVPHAFTTRVGGASTGPFSSLNFGNPSELPPGVVRDPKPSIEENFRRTLEAIGCAGRRIVQVHQIHGATVHVVRRQGEDPAAFNGIDWGSVKADAIVTNHPGVVAAVRVADCCPVLVASTDGRVVGAVHAGWRGVVAGVLPAAVAAMRELGAGGCIAAVGPRISVDHFEVGPEVVAEFRRVFGNDAGVIRAHSDPVGAAAGKGFVDLKRALQLQLLSEGVNETDVFPHCTARRADLFFSHRRDAGITGRMAALIGPVA